MELSKKLTFEYIKKFVAENSNCELESLDYKGVDSPLNFKCGCGNPFTTTFYQFDKKNKRQCNDCGNVNRKEKHKHSHNYIEEYVKEFKYKLLTETYENMTFQQLELECENGHIRHTTFCNFKISTGCPECNGTDKWDYESMKEYIEITSNSGYKYLSKEYNPKEKLHLLCDKGHECFIKLGNFMPPLSRRCPICNGGVRLSYEKVKNDIEVESNSGYKLLSLEYKNNATKLLMLCDKGHECNISYGKFKSGRRCPICNESKGEQKVREVLTNRKFIFNYDFPFNDCLSDLGNPLRFDFPAYKDISKKEVIFIIEYDGEFHYLPIISKKRLKYQQILDGKKNNYCLINNIPLLRIPYWDFDNIEIIIDDFIKNLSNNKNNYTSIKKVGNA